MLPILIVLVSLALLRLGAPTALGAEERTGQRLPSISGTHGIVSFGMSVKDVETTTRKSAKVREDFKPHGIVKDLEIGGLFLFFVKDRLLMMSYKASFDYTIPITPFAESRFNPPRDARIVPGMPLASFIKVLEVWANGLAKSGLRPIDCESKQSVTSKTFRVCLHRGRGYWSTLQIGPCFPSLYDVCKAKVDWGFNFDDRGGLEDFNAENGAFAQPWIIR